MKTIWLSTWASLLALLCQTPLFAVSEEEARTKLESFGAKCTVKDGHVRGVSLPKRSTPEQVALLEFLPEVETLGAQHTIAPSESWTVLHKLKKLNSLVVWDSHEIQDLRVFADLPVKSLLLGGVMGLKKGDRQEDAIQDVSNLPNLTRFYFAHGLLAKKDSHVQHVCQSFPNLNDLWIDFGLKEDRAVSSSGFDLLGSLKSLARIEIEGEGLTPEIFERIFKAPKLKEVVLRLGRPEGRVVSQADVDALQAKYPAIKISVK